MNSFSSGSILPVNWLMSFTSSSPRRMAAALLMPAMIFLYPVQRQTLPLIALFISSSVGSGSRSIRALAAITMPGMQKPHCTEPAVPKAYTNASFSRRLRPSTVMMFLPTALSVVRTHDFTAYPSTTIVHVPQAPSEHPSLTEYSLRSSLRYLSRGFFSSVVLSIPFTVNV